MATLTPRFTLTGSAADLGAALSLSVDDSLTIDEPFIGMSRITASTTGADSIILPSANVPRYVYIKHTGLNSAGSASTDKIHVETSDSATIMELKAGEFAFFPYYAEGSCLLQLETSANTVQV